MSRNFKKIICALCAFGVAINTSLFGINLFMDYQFGAVFNLSCAIGCWVGYFKFRDEIGEE